MKALACLLSLLFAAYADAAVFMTPDEADGARHALERTLATVHEQLLIITPKLDAGLWERSLLKALKNGTKVTVVTSDPPGDGAAALARFKYVEVRTASGLSAPDYGGALSLTLVIADGTTACRGTLPLTRQQMEHDLGMFECSDREIAAHIKTAERIVARSRPYLEE